MQTTRSLTILCLAALLAVPTAWAQPHPETAPYAPAMLAGAFPAPPTGAGPGKIAVVTSAREAHSVAFGQAGSPSGNSFYIAVDPVAHRLFVPTNVGTTYVLNTRTWKVERSFPSIAGGRVAKVSKRLGLLFVLSGRELAAYGLADGTPRYTVPFGGNALAFGPHGAHLYVGGNMDNSIADVDSATGRMLRRIPVAHSGDLAWADGWLFSADIRNGVMTAVDPQDNRIVEMATPEVDPAFRYDRIPAATAGFMQLAVSPGGRTVYAAGFSGHVLRFSAHEPAYLGEVKLAVPSPAKLSGLTLIDVGHQAVVAVENRNEAVRFDLSSGKVLQRFPGISSNRWVAMQ